MIDQTDEREPSLQDVQESDILDMADSANAMDGGAQLSQRTLPTRRIQGTGNPLPKENMKARSRRVFNTLPEVVEKKLQEERLRERQERLQKAKTFSQVRRRGYVQLLTFYPRHNEINIYVASNPGCQKCLEKRRYGSEKKPGSNS